MDGDMNTKNTTIRTPLVFMLLVLFCVSACSTIHLNTVPAPPPSAKLRVFVMPISGEPKGKLFGTGYLIPYEEFVKFTFNMAGKHLRDTGIYDVVSREDIQTVLGTGISGIDDYWWLRNDHALLKQVGKALHADYAMIVMRNYVINVTYSMVIINLETGKKYTSSDVLPLVPVEERVIKMAYEIYKKQYKKIFYDAKSDMLATAIRKGRLMPREEIKKPAVPETTLALAPPPVSQTIHVPTPVEDRKKLALAVEMPLKPIPPMSKTGEEVTVSQLQPPSKPALEPPPTTKTSPVSKPPAPPARPAVSKEPQKSKTPVADSVSEATVIAKTAPALQPELPAVDKRREFEKKLELDMQSETPATDKTKLVVYDFDTVERLSVVALILTDALREELFMLGAFSLVNRENMMQVVQELKLQYSGMVDDKQIVELGKWLAANQAVTGRLAVLGNSYILQAKRTDIKTMGTLGLGTLKCSSGQEEELLVNMPGLARRLVESKK
jgi:curli biogenesis system outer membrane secretion channel CsgG